MATDFQMRQIFQKKFYDVIAPKLRQYDGERLKKLAKVKKINTWLFVIAGVVFLFTVFLSVIFSMPIFQLGFVSIIMCIATLAVKSIISKNFENKMKAIIMPAVCSIFGDLRWYGGAYNYEGIFRESKLLVRYTHPNHRSCNKDISRLTFESIC